jgi:predicted nucleotidyltransferase
LAARAQVFAGIGAFCAEVLPRELDLTVVIYGSVARSDSALASDVDVLVVFPDAIDPEARADFSYRIAGHIERVTGNEAQVFSIERAELAQRVAENDPFIANVLADGILVHGPALHA